MTAEELARTTPLTLDQAERAIRIAPEGVDCYKVVEALSRYTYRENLYVELMAVLRCCSVSELEAGDLWARNTLNGDFARLDEASSELGRAIAAPFQGLLNRLAAWLNKAAGR